MSAFAPDHDESWAAPPLDDPALEFVHESRRRQQHCTPPERIPTPPDGTFAECAKRPEWQRHSYFRSFVEHVRRYEMHYNVSLECSRVFWFGVVSGILFAHRELVDADVFIEEAIRFFHFSDYEIIVPFKSSIDLLVVQYKGATSLAGQEAVRGLIGEELASYLVQTSATQRFVPIAIRAHELAKSIAALRAAADKLDDQRFLLLTTPPARAFAC